MERPTTHVTGAILFFGAVSFDAVIISAEQYKFVPCFTINSLSLLPELFQIIAKRSLALFKYRLVATRPKVNLLRHTQTFRAVVTFNR